MQGPVLPGVLQRAEARRVYGADPVGYEDGRPDYPDRVYEILASRCGLRAGAAVLEIGPGTGRVTRRLHEAGARVVTVEPDAALAAYLRTVVEGTTTRVVHSSFEESPFESAEFDLAVAAMSFHWVNTSIGLPKLRRVIRSRGWVALWWTLYGDPTRRDLFHDKTRALLGDPRDADVSSRPPFELDEDGWRYALEREGGFIDVDVERIHWTARFELPGLRAFYRTLIGVRRLAPDDQQALLNRLESVAADDFGGVVERPFVTAVYTARRP